MRESDAGSAWFFHELYYNSETKDKLQTNGSFMGIVPFDLWKSLYNASVLQEVTMLQIKRISKRYKTGDLIQIALDEISLNLRDNEFVAILGPSGSGKTTLLNIIGGLDRYDSGDLIINTISTKQYKDRDWDSYRNHTIGFVFQSYNLIPHQSIVSNVELALTISGISRSERRERAKKALDEVGLQGQYHKLPNQMSGGQMQRVAIARALVNNPDILLADEPTGALDTETSLQVMDLLKEVAKNRLVVMVTHNPELAQRYATRIVKLRDGRVIDDTDVFEIDESVIPLAIHQSMGKSSMSLLTSLSLSFNNLRTKKGRTFLTAFAGSIGIIGIALILALSTGVNQYIEDIQKSTMTSYPITINSQSFDLGSVLEASPRRNPNQKPQHELDGIYVDSTRMEMSAAMTTSISENNLTQFKKYLDDKESEIHQYIGENGIVYAYQTKFAVYTHDSEGLLINTDGSTLREKQSMRRGGFGIASMFGMGNDNTSNFEQLLPGANGERISSVVTESYDVVYGSWPTKFNEVVLVLDHNHEISATTLYEIGVLPTSEYRQRMAEVQNDETISFVFDSLRYEDIVNQPLQLLLASDTYVLQNNDLYTQWTSDAQLETLLEDALPLIITGVIVPKEGADYDGITKPFGYTKALTDYVIEKTNDSEVVKAQRASQNINVLNGVQFEPLDDEAKIADTLHYISLLGVTEKANLFKSMLVSVPSNQNSRPMPSAELSETQMAAILDNYLKDPEDDVMLAIYNTYISAGSYDENMEAFGVISLDAPSSISIYADSFEDKDAISESITRYNETASKEHRIVYTDYVALLMSSITTIINVISYVLIAFVAVSLIVSSIMIGIITYISVLERTKEIGILRAIGASKKNISQVFNAETFIIGLFSGVLGIGIALLLIIPGNAIIHKVTGNMDVNAILPPVGALILIGLSMVLTLIGGLIPAQKAAKKDPVIALRSE